jgi:hypothetical protein
LQAIEGLGPEDAERFSVGRIAGEQTVHLQEPELQFFVVGQPLTALELLVTLLRNGVGIGWIDVEEQALFFEDGEAAEGRRICGV